MVKKGPWPSTKKIYRQNHKRMTKKCAAAASDEGPPIEAHLRDVQNEYRKVSEIYMTTPVDGFYETRISAKRAGSSRKQCA